jgi:monovalent cation/hydrogen antiporter
MGLLRLHDDGSVEREIGIARAETARAALSALEGINPSSPSADVLRGEYQARLRAGGMEGEDWVRVEADLPALQKRAVAVQRQTLRELRARQKIGDDAFHVVEEEIDLLDLTANPLRLPPGTAASSKNPVQPG